MAGEYRRAALFAFLVLSLPASPAWAQTSDTTEAVSATRVVLEPVGGTRVTVGERLYGGTLAVEAHSGGLALVEDVDVESYLLGIREVPFSWPDASLAAQAVAARTYLAWTLERGRSPNGRRFAYDICATTACQVYAGVGGLVGADGERWVRAVRSTAGEILVAGGVPIQALYSSTSDGRTRNVEDVFPGSSPISYLKAVESPDETSPFVSWSFMLTARQAAAMFDHAGLVEGQLIDINSHQTADGDGPWTVTVESSRGSRTVDTWTLRTLLNRAAAALFPETFPALRPESDRRYPQTIMSPNYTITPQFVVTRVEYGPLSLERQYRVDGGGWGHLVGMSQYGAEAMARAGADHASILAHFYGGVRPVVTDSLPARIRVGLFTEASELRFVPGGPVRVVIDGREVAAAELGPWVISVRDGVAIVEPPEGLGLAPEVYGWQAFFDSRGVVQLVTVRSRTAAEIRVVIREQRVVVFDSGFHIREAGVIAIDLDPRLQRSAISVEVTARSPEGIDTSVFRILGGAE